MTNLRIPKDIRTFEKDGEEYVVADGNGISVEDFGAHQKTTMSGYTWIIPKGTSFPFGLKLHRKNSDRKGHYYVAPINTMTKVHFLSLLSLLGNKCVLGRKL